MSFDDQLNAELLTRLEHAHPHGLGKEILDNYRGERQVLEHLALLQDKGYIHQGTVDLEKGEQALKLPVKLTAAGVEAAQRSES